MWNGPHSSAFLASSPMTETTDLGTMTARVLRADEGETAPSLGGVTNRFMIGSEATGGRIALVQHLFAPRAIAAPMHRHRDDDEFSYVLYGRIGAVSDGVELTAGPGDLLFKPHGQWHTFWNAGDEPAAVLELISPGGLEELFRALGTVGGKIDPEVLVALADRHGCDLDLPATEPVVARHGLTW